MKVTTKGATRLTKTPLVVLFAPEGAEPRLPEGVEVPRAARADFRGEVRQAIVVPATGGPAERVAFVGLGKADAVDGEAWRRAGALAARVAEGRRVSKATLWLGDAPAGPDEFTVGCAVAEGAVLGRYDFQACKGEAKPKYVQALTIVGGGDARKGAARGLVTAEACAFTRDLQNLPGNRMTPRDMAARARALARRSDRITCKVLDEAAMERMGMGLLLSVSQGSEQPARLVHLTYKPKGKSKGRVAFVGKGLTFDAGGVSLKPAAKMDEMRYDMSGGAAVLGAFHALGGLDVPHEVHGIVPCSENLTNGRATKPGDVHTGMCGKTVEILNTDAEGRLILADALTYTQEKVKPDTIIDLATLTGAVIVALGHEVTGMFASSPALERALRTSGEAVGERVWPLPLFPEHREAMKGANADLKNIGAGDLGAGSTQGAAFLAHFVGDGVEWAHLDIAGTAWNTRNRDWVGGAQGSGVGTRLLIHYLESRS